MYLLEKKGYHRDPDITFDGAGIWYRHPNQRVPTIILYPDGKAVAVNRRYSSEGVPVNQEPKKASVIASTTALTKMLSCSRIG